MYLVFLITLALLPFSYGFGKFEVGGVTLSPYTVGICIVLGLGLLGWLMGRVRGLIGLHDISIFILAFTYLASTLLADNVVEAGFLAFHALFVPAVTYFAVRAAIQTEHQYDRAIGIFFLGVLAFAVVVVFEFLGAGSRTRVLGMPPIGVATLCVAALVCAFNYRRRILYKLSAGVVGVALVLTFSRMYLMSLSLSPFLLKWFKRARAPKVFVVFIVVTLMSTVIMAFNADFFRPTQYNKDIEFSADRLTDINFLLGSIYGRASSYRDGIESFLHAPVFGHGLFKGEYMVTQHNFHVEWLQYGGFVGYVAYVVFLFIHVRRANRFVRVDGWIPLNLVAMAILLFNSLTNGLMHGIMPTVLFLVLGLTEVRIRLAGDALVGSAAAEKALA